MKEDINFYDKALKKVKLLSREEEVEVCKRIKNGDLTAEKELLASSYRTVRQIAAKTQRQGVELDDLIQEGNLGLIHAAKNFDIAENVRFNTYAIFWIRQQIQRYYHNKVRLVRIPVGKEAEQNTIRSFASEFFQNKGRKPTIEEISTGTCLSVKTVKQLKIDTALVCSLDTEINEESGDMYQLLQDNRYCPESQFCKQSELQVVQKSLGCLTEREQEVVKMRFGFYDREYTLKEVGQKFEISCEACRQIQLRATEKIRRYILGLKKSGKI